jgi:hypothetical protein
MRIIESLKYGGECRKCGAEIAAGERAGYERRVGIFCPDCMPTDSEEIREYRLEGAERKAERLDGWAQKREERAERQLNSHPEIRRDWAFITQPGRIPLRERMNRADERACESMAKARSMRGRAASLRSSVRVKGDADAKRHALRDYVRARIKPGDDIKTAHFGRGTVLKVNRKTARIGNCGTSGTYETLVDLSFIVPPEPDTSK